MSRIERGIAKTWTGSILMGILSILIGTGSISKHYDAPWTVRIVPVAMCATAASLGKILARRMRTRGPRRRRATETEAEQWHSLSCFALLSTTHIGNTGLPVVGMMLLILRWNTRRNG
jgi:hypothetical protein